MELDLSAIVIARNEEVRIAACLEACLRSIEIAADANLIQTWEVILVDSASEDRTVEIARRYPVIIVHLPAEWPLSAAAGRFVGTRQAHGKLLLFVDGDFVLAPEWLPDAIRALLRNEEVAAVCGPEIEKMTGDSVLMRHIKAHIESLQGEPTAINVGLYRREPLETAGGIHPFLRGAEDRDVAYRLRAAGYRLMRVHGEMGTHHWSDRDTLDFITYFRSVLFWSVGDGQLYRVRRHLRTARSDIRRRYVNVRYVHDYLLGLGVVLLGLINLSALTPVGPWIAGVVDSAVVLALGAAKHSYHETWREFLYRFHVVLYILVRHGGFLIGYTRPPADPSRYPTGEQVERAIPGARGR